MTDPLHVEEFKLMLARIRENRDRLDACPSHQFPHAREWVFDFKISRIRCSRCGGEMGRIDVFSYAKGYAAAGGDVEDVVPGLRSGEEKPC